MKPVAEADAAPELVAVLPHIAGSIIRGGGNGGSIAAAVAASAVRQLGEQMAGFEIRHVVEWSHERKRLAAGVAEISVEMRFARALSDDKKPAEERHLSQEAEGSRDPQLVKEGLEEPKCVWVIGRHPSYVRLPIWAFRVEDVALRLEGKLAATATPETADSTSASSAAAAAERAH